MAETLRPQVLVSEVLQQLVNSGTNPITVGIIGVSTGGDATKFQSFDNIADVEDEYGSNTGRSALLVDLARAAFRNGAGLVKAITVGAPVLTQAATTLSAAAAAGATTIDVTSATGLSGTNKIYIGSYVAGFKYEEWATISSVASTTLTLSEPLQFAHAAGEAVAEVTVKSSSDYTAAFAALELDKDIQIAVCDSDDATILGNFQAAVTNAIAKNNMMVGIRGIARGTSESSAKSAATAINKDEIFMFYPTLTDEVGRYLTGAYGAAAVAGAICGRGIPYPNYNLLTLQGFTGVEAQIADFDACTAAGLSVIELQGTDIRATRLMTTSVTIDSVNSDLLEEGSVRLNVNSVQRTIQRRLESKYLTVGNTSSVRNQIQSEVKNMLQTFNDEGILAEDETTGTPGFKDPIVKTNATNRKQVDVEIEIAPTQPLVFIKLNFKLNL